MNLLKNKIIKIKKNRKKNNYKFNFKAFQKIIIVKMMTIMNKKITIMKMMIMLKNRKNNKN